MSMRQSAILESIDDASGGQADRSSLAVPGPANPGADVEGVSFLRRLLGRFPCVSVMNQQRTKVFLRRFYIIKSRFLSVYVHQITSDEDGDMHDHPWMFLILILKQGYREVMPKRTVIRKRLDLIFHLPTCRHRIELIDNIPSWSLVIMGPKVREWGFHTIQGWVPFKKYGNKSYKKGCE